jgi:hypothetical protein
MHSLLRRRIHGKLRAPKETTCKYVYLEIQCQVSVRIRSGFTRYHAGYRRLTIVTTGREAHDLCFCTFVIDMGRHPEFDSRPLDCTTFALNASPRMTKETAMNYQDDVAFRVSKNIFVCVCRPGATSCAFCCSKDVSLFCPRLCNNCC